MVTVLYEGDETTNPVTNSLDDRGVNRKVGPLLNPALAFGQMIISFNFSFILQYVLVPFAGAILALVFYEFVFVKSQEYLNDGETSEQGDNKEFTLPDEINSP